MTATDWIGAAWGPAAMNKGGGPRVPNCARKKICLTFVLFDLAGVSGFGRLRGRIPMGVCLEIAGSGGIRSQRKEWREALLLLPSWANPW